MSKLTIAAGLALAVVAAGATPATADETFVANYGSLTSMVDGIFGAGNWVRLDDNADQLWAASPTGGNVGTVVTHKLAAYDQNLGYVQGGTFTQLIGTATPGESSSQPERITRKRAGINSRVSWASFMQPAYASFGL